MKETCVQYYDRRLREGWKCVKLEGFSATLLSPEGIRRDLDLRSDVETLRPNGVGAETGCDPNPGGNDNWECVDETPAVDSDRVEVSFADARDLYALPNHSVGTGTISKITVYFRCYTYGDETGNYAHAVIRSNTTVTEGDQESFAAADTWYNFSMEWAQNPVGPEDWTWDDIDALQIGVRLDGERGGAYCSQVYVEIDYTPPAAGWTGKISGVTDPAKIMGVDVANIAKVKGVA